MPNGAGSCDNHLQPITRSEISTVNTPDLVIGKRYWYRWANDWEANSGLLIGFTETEALFESLNLSNKCVVVKLKDVKCEDTRKPKPSFFRIW